MPLDARIKMLKNDLIPITQQTPMINESISTFVIPYGKNTTLKFGHLVKNRVSYSINVAVITTKVLCNNEHPSQDHKLRYFAIGSTAATINVLSLSAGFYFLYHLAEDKEWVL